MINYSKISKHSHKTPYLTIFNTGLLYNCYIYKPSAQFKSDGIPLMRIILFIAFIFGSTCSIYAQTASITGAWEFNEDDKTHHLFFMDGMYFHTVSQGSKFIMTRGGSYEIKNDQIKSTILFNSADSSQVGLPMNVNFSATDNALSLHAPEGRVYFKRIDDGKAPLAGVWRITGRMQEDGKIAAIHQSGTRQTYKMLTGTKFQWVAIDPEKKQFSGTGGGSYTFKDGKYTENIEFFSRDNSRVGASLAFDGKLEDGAWHHSGLSSKGAKIYEVWSRIK